MSIASRKFSAGKVFLPCVFELGLSKSGEIPRPHNHNKFGFLLKILGGGSSTLNNALVHKTQLIDCSVTSYIVLATTHPLSGATGAKGNHNIPPAFTHRGQYENRSCRRESGLKAKDVLLKKNPGCVAPMRALSVSNRSSHMISRMMRDTGYKTIK